MLRPAQALWIALAAAILLIATAPLLVPLGAWGGALSEVLWLAGPCLAAAWLVRRRAARTALLGPPPRIRDLLGLTLPSLRPRAAAAALAAAALIGATFWYLNVWLVTPLARHLSGWEELSRLERAVTQTPLVELVVAMVAVPAVCEELLFRGVLARALRRPLGALGATVTSAAIFGLFHVVPARWLPTGALGLVLAAATLRSGSVLPAMLIHAINNAIAVALSRGAPGPLADALDAHPHLLGVVAAVLCAAGATVFFQKTSRSGGFPSPEQTC